MASARFHLMDVLNTTSDAYWSTSLLADRLNMPPHTVRQYVKALEKDGHVIENNPHKGYRLVQSPEQATSRTIQRGLKTSWLGRDIIYQMTVDSTQKLAHQMARNDARDGTVIISDEQTGGRGRMGRTWHSAQHKGVWMSLILRPNLTPAAATQLTLLTAVALADVVSEQTKANPAIKWPNDLLINHKKTAGILTETQTKKKQIQYIIVGIGMNVNHTHDDFTTALKSNATSIKIETKEEQSIVTLIQNLLQAFEQTYDTFIDHGFSDIRKKWETYAYRLGSRMRIQSNDTSFEAVFTGMADDGALRVRTDTGEMRSIYAGDITWLT